MSRINDIATSLLENFEFARAEGSDDPFEAMEARADFMATRDSLSMFIELSWRCFDTVDFIGGWHIDCIADHLMAAGMGQFAGKHLLMNIPPGCSKSSTCSVAWPAWEWARGSIETGQRLMGEEQFLDHTTFSFLCTSYRFDLAKRDSQKFRDLISSAWYRRTYPHVELRKDRDSVRDGQMNSVGGYRKGVPVSGVMGEGARFVLNDDPHNTKGAESDTVREETIANLTRAMPTRLRVPEYGCDITIMQRLHELDMSGHFITNEYSRTVHVCLPMEYECDYPFPMKTPLEKWKVDPRTEEGELLCPQRYNRDAVDALKDMMEAKEGAYVTAGQLQQRPAPRKGSMFARDRWQYVEPSEFPPEDEIVGWALGGDLAATVSATSARTAFAWAAITADKKVYVKRVLARKTTPGQMQSWLRALHKELPSNVVFDLPQDPAQAGVTQKVILAEILMGRPFYLTSESGDKELRAQGFAAAVENGRVFLERGDWNKDLLDEAEPFPRGTYKDRIDALSRMFTRLMLLYTVQEVDEIALPVEVAL